MSHAAFALVFLTMQEFRAIIRFSKSSTSLPRIVFIMWSLKAPMMEYCVSPVTAPVGGASP